MTLMRKGALAALFGALALAGCKWTVGTADGTLAMDLDCESSVLNQTLTLHEGETLYSYDTNDGQPYYGLTRKTEEIEVDRAFTTTVNTEVEIRMYDHDRWVCRDAEGSFVDYKSAPTIK
ncbi:MAG TPA: hypothetical protein EYG18_03360 [Micavibrio sp.]|nr:hypothetical protein [Micavibrio sp.]HIL28286.1 hypothetical protein [Micavibrio sp.]